LIGTVNWMPPEVIKQANSGRFGDIWSLGCTVIEMATGKLPWTEFVGSNPFALMYQIVNSNSSPKIPDYLSHQAQDFLMNCLR
jgi:serine/threonine protein kinase